MDYLLAEDIVSFMVGDFGGYWTEEDVKREPLSNRIEVTYGGRKFVITVNEVKDEDQ